MTPLKAIRAHCLACSNDSANEVKLCPIKDCPLYAYRFGHDPALKGRNNNGDPSFGERMMELKRRKDAVSQQEATNA